MKETIIKCDICKKQVETQELRIPVRFLTEQNEGKPCKPYISMTKMDICDDCLLKCTNIEACGAMGYNTYILKESCEEEIQKNLPNSILMFTTQEGVKK